MVKKVVCMLMLTSCMVYGSNLQDKLLDSLSTKPYSLRDPESRLQEYEVEKFILKAPQHDISGLTFPDDFYDENVAGGNIIHWIVQHQDYDFTKDCLKKLDDRNLISRLMKGKNARNQTPFEMISRDEDLPMTQELLSRYDDDAKLDDNIGYNKDYYSKPYNYEHESDDEF